MCNIDFDPPRMYSATLRTARKTHKCGECARKIQAGEKYQHVVGVWDGDFQTFKTCAHCLAGQQLLRNECGGFLHEGVEEDLVEHIYPGIPWAMKAARIVVGMRRKWRKFKSTELMSVPAILETSL